MKIQFPHKNTHQQSRYQQSRYPQSHFQKGFTLMELVITMVIVGIMTLGMTNFIQIGTKGYSDSIARQSVQNQSRFLIERITREVRNAVPNSIEINGDGSCLTFTPIILAGYYTKLPAQSSEGFEFSPQDETFDKQSIEGLNVVVSPMSTADFYPTTSAQSFTASSVEKVADTGGINIYKTTVDADFNENGTIGSISKRVYFYQDSVQFCIDAASGRATRSQAERTALSSANLVQIGEFVEGGEFLDATGDDELAVSRANNNIVHLTLVLTNNDDTTSISSNEIDIKVLNAP